MKSLGDPSFFRLFDLLVGATNRGLKRSYWTHDGVEFERDRHSASGPKHGLTIDIFTLTRPGRRGWSLIVIKEYWWAGAENKPVKSLRWARLISGQRGDALSWLRAQDTMVGRDTFSDRAITSDLDGKEPVELEDDDIA
jgi:hypothetical protein